MGCVAVPRQGSFPIQHSASLDSRTIGLLVARLEVHALAWDQEGPRAIGQSLTKQNNSLFLSIFRRTLQIAGPMRKPIPLQDPELQNPLLYPSKCFRTSLHRKPCQACVAEWPRKRTTAKSRCGNCRSIEAKMVCLVRRNKPMENAAAKTRQNLRRTSRSGMRSKPESKLRGLLLLPVRHQKSAHREYPLSSGRKPQPALRAMLRNIWSSPWPTVVQLRAPGWMTSVMRSQR